MFRIVATAAAAGVTLPPFFRYFSVSTPRKMVESNAMRSSSARISGALRPRDTMALASSTDCRMVTEMR